jgi:hypothetical protein
VPVEGHLSLFNSLQLATICRSCSPDEDTNHASRVQNLERENSPASTFLYREAFVLRYSFVPELEWMLRYCLY